MIGWVAASQLEVRCLKISKPKSRWIAAKKIPVLTTEDTEFSNETDNEAYRVAFA